MMHIVYRMMMSVGRRHVRTRMSVECVFETEARMRDLKCIDGRIMESILDVNFLKRKCIITLTAMTLYIQMFKMRTCL